MGEYNAELFVINYRYKVDTTMHFDGEYLWQSTDSILQTVYVRLQHHKKTETNETTTEIDNNNLKTETTFVSFVTGVDILSK